MKSAILLCAIALIAGAQVPYQRLRDAVREPQNWLTYNGSYASTHYSTLDQIRSDNVSALELKWCGRPTRWRRSRPPLW